MTAHPLTTTELMMMEALSGVASDRIAGLLGPLLVTRFGPVIAGRIGDQIAGIAWMSGRG